MGDAWQLYTSTILQVLFLSAMASLLTLAIENFQREWMMRMLHQRQHMDLVVVLLIVAIFFIVFLTVFVSIVILRHMDALARDEATELKKAVYFACNRKRIFTLFRASVLILLIVAVGLMAFILPGLVLIVFLSLVMPLVVISEEGAFAAIKHSFQFVWGHWWYTLGVVMAPVATAIILAFLIDRMVTDHIGRLIVDWVLSSLFTPWIYATQLVLLHELGWRHSQVYDG